MSSFLSLTRQNPPIAQFYRTQMTLKETCKVTRLRPRFPHKFVILSALPAHYLFGRNFRTPSIPGPPFFPTDSSRHRCGQLERLPKFLHALLNTPLNPKHVPYVTNLILPSLFASHFSSYPISVDLQSRKRTFQRHSRQTRRSGSIDWHTPFHFLGTKSRPTTPD